jgi:hypothetical protein
MEESENEPVTGPGPEGQPGGPQLSDEEIAMLEQQMREIRMEDILTQTVVSVINLTARRIAKEDEVDLDQARLGIEAVRSLLPLLPEEVSKEIREPLSQIQLLYAQKSGEGDPAGQPGTGEGSPDPGPGDGPAGGAGESGLWTPRGS